VGKCNKSSKTASANHRVSNRDQKWWLAGIAKHTPSVDFSRYWQRHILFENILDLRGIEWAIFDAEGLTKPRIT
jgi:hypothetical protein